MRTEDLIKSLIADASPVRRLPDQNGRRLRWAALASVCVAAGALCWGARPDLAGKAHDASFLLEAGCLLFLFACAARSAFELSVPGEERPFSSLWVPPLAFLPWLTLILYRFFRGWETSAYGLDARPGYLCVWRVLILGGLPALTGFLLLRKAAPLKTRLAGSYLCLSAFAIAALGARTLCVIDRPGHLLFWHALPLLLLALTGSALGPRVLGDR